jgi:Helix-turn-helix domain
MVWRIHFTAADLGRIRVNPTLGPLAETVMALSLLRCPLPPRALFGEWRSAVYQVLVQPYWARIHACLHAEQMARRRTLAYEGGDRLLASLQNQWIRWRPPVLEVLVPGQTEMHLAGRGIALVPLPYSSASALAALVGRNRAAVLGSIADGCTTTELAERVRISVAAASQHASVLRDAGLIVTRRQGGAVLHLLTPLGTELLDAG